MPGSIVCQQVYRARSRLVHAECPGVPSLLFRLTEIAGQRDQLRGAGAAGGTGGRVPLERIVETESEDRQIEERELQTGPRWEQFTCRKDAGAQD